MGRWLRARGEYADGLGWLALIEKLGDALPPEYELKRQRWTASVATAPLRVDEGR